MTPVHELIIVARPVDAVIGAGGQFARWRAPAFVYVTDSAPAGAAERQWAETTGALASAGIAADRAATLGFHPWELARRWVELANLIAGIVDRLQPRLIFTHAYEGGHPDHDAVACAVQTACGAQSILEFTGYHERAGRLEVGEFLPGDTPVVTVRLSAEQRAGKRALYECHRSHAEWLAHFPVDQERFRPVPQNNFRRAPHAERGLFEADHESRRGGTGVYG